MKSSVPFILTFVFLLTEVMNAQGQLRSQGIRAKAYMTSTEPAIKVKRWFLPGLLPDKDRTAYKPSVAHLSLPMTTTALMGDDYWIGSITQQSYNQGKIGRYYYWDLQGNLRGSYLFLDIAGKNKRGLKLVFPRHRALF